MQRKGLLPQLQAQIRSQVFTMLLDAEVINLRRCPALLAVRCFGQTSAWPISTPIPLMQHTASSSYLAALGRLLS